MNKLFVLGITSVAAIGVLGVTSLNVSALNGTSNGNGNGKQSSLESRAKIFGMTATELSKALETKTMSQIAIEKGMDEATFKAKVAETAKARWESHGLNSEEIASRLADREKRQAANATDHTFGSGDGNHQGGYGKNR